MMIAISYETDDPKWSYFSVLSDKGHSTGYLLSKGLYNLERTIREYNEGLHERMDDNYSNYSFTEAIPEEMFR